MVSDKLFEKIEQLEKQSERMLQEAYEEAEKIKSNTQSSIENIKQENEYQLQQFIMNKQEEIEKEKKVLSEKYINMFNDISQMILSRRDQYLKEIVNTFKKEIKKA